MHKAEGEATPELRCAPSLMTEALGYRWTTAPFRIYHQDLPGRLTDENEAQRLVETIIQEAWPVAHLREQIRHLGMKPKGRRRADLAHQYIYDGFVSREAVQQRWEELSETERLALPYWLLANRLRLLSISPPDIFPIRDLSIPFHQLSREMARAGMGIVSPNGEVLAPLQLLANLPQLSFPIPPAQHPALPPPSPTDPYLPVIRLQALLEHLAESKRSIPLRPHAEWRITHRFFSLSGWGWPPLPAEARIIHQQHRLPKQLTLCPLPPAPEKEVLRTWASRLNLDEEDAEFSYHLLQALFPHDKTEITEETLQQWRDLDPYRSPLHLMAAYQQILRWAAWFPAWRRGLLTVRWNFTGRSTTEVATAIAISGLRIRHALLLGLAFLPHGTWIAVEAARNTLYRFFPSPTTLMPNRLRITDTETGHWLETLGRLLVAILRGPLYNLGLVTLFPNRQTPTHFALFHLQDFLFARYEVLHRTLDTSFHADRFHFDPRHKLLRLTPPISPDIHHFLQRIASLHAIQSHALLYKPDAARLHTTFEADESPTTLAQTWQRLFGFDVPEALRQWWHQYWQQYGHIRLYPHQAILITRDDFTMRELQTALPHLRHQITAQISPRIVLINHTDAPTVIEQLQRTGYIPKLEA